MKYQFIEKHRSRFTVKKMCQVLKISVSGYQHWRTREPSSLQIRKERLKKRIFELYVEHNRMAGSPMITADLSDESEFSNVSPNTVARLMREMNSKSRTVRKFVATTDSKQKEPVVPNLLNREFDIKEPNGVRVSDITYLRIGRKWHYLTVFMNLFSRSIVGWNLSDSLERYSAIRALKML